MHAARIPSASALAETFVTAMPFRPVGRFAVIVATLALGACGGSSGGGSIISAPPPGGGSPTPTVDAVSVSLGTSVRNVPIQSGVPTEFSFTYSVPPGLLPASITSYESFAVDLADTMQHVSITSSPVAGIFDPMRLVNLVAHSRWFSKLLGIGDVMAAVNASVTVRVSYPGDPNVCSSNTVLGPFDFTGDVGMEPTSDTATATATGASPDIHVVTAGSFELCVSIAPLTIPADAYLTVDRIEVEATVCDETPPTDASAVGVWSGTYSCSNFGTGNDTNQPISLTISRNTDGTYTYIDDGGATYRGHFCGSTFRFNGGLSGAYTESGYLTLDGSGGATKHSTWNSIPAGFSGGSCTDALTKQ